jgi:Na+/H+ antiporter NhaC
VQTTSLLLSALFFVDDYLSNLLVGNIMRPLVDSYGISRVKLAYLLNSMAASFCVLIPATSWVAMILVQLQVSGIAEQLDKNPLIQADPYVAYLSFMPFLFYPALTVFGAWFVVQFGIRWGLMEQFEKRSESHEVIEDNGVEGSLLDFAIPLGFFVGSLMIGVLFSGGYYLFGGNNSLLEAVQKADIFAVLFYSSLSAVFATLIWYGLKKNNISHLVIHAFKQAIGIVKNSLLLLSLAWTLSSFFRFELQAGQQLAAYLQAVPFKELIPVLVFVLSAGISAITGTAWGTIGLLFPLVVPLVASLNAPAAAILTMPLLLPSLAAVISGSIAGGQISPIADSVCMSSMSAGTPLLDHVQTQQQYVVPIWIATVVAYVLVVVLPFTSMINLCITWVTAFTIVMGFHLIKNKY